MAEIRPFRCIRPADGYAARVAALPYDVYSREEAYAEAAKDRLSFLNIDRPETQFPPSADMYAPEVYRKAGKLLQARRREGILIQDPTEGYYLYELTMDGRTQTGLVACASIDDYTGQVIRRHENTRAEKEADRVRHVDACSMQTGPIFLAYRRNEEISAIVRSAALRPPLFDFVSADGIRHRGWRIGGREEICRIHELFSGIGRLYIADGHHRAASAVRVGLQRRERHPGYSGNEEFNYFLSILFPDDELLIMDYNRVVKDLNGLTPQEFLARTRESFDVSPCDGPQRPVRKGMFSMCLEGRWYSMNARRPFTGEDPVADLDVSILQNELLGPVLGIGDPKTDPRIGFIGGIRGLEELERRVRTDCAVAFALFPTSIGELFAVADAGRLMPPKSTWFEPKLRSGLFLHEIER